MPLLRTLTTKIKTAISPSTSPSTSPTSPQVTPTFERVSARKDTTTATTTTTTTIHSGPAKRPSETHMRMDSFMTPATNPSKENVGSVEKKRRMSRFREELDVGDA